MKKIIIALAALLCAAAIAAGTYHAGRAGAYCAGYADGVQHAIEDSIIFTVDVYNPDAPEESAWGEFDQLIYIELDDETYVHGMYQC